MDAVVAQDPHAWQNETSVRHVGGAAPGAPFTYGPSGHGTPTSQYPPDAGASPQRQSQVKSDYPNQHGPMGVTGAG